MDEVFIRLHRAARQHGIRALAQRLGAREKTLYAKLDPEDDWHQPKLGEFVAILNNLPEHEAGDILEALVGQFGYQLATKSREQAANVTTGVMHAVTETADIMRAYERAIADGQLSDRERAEIKRECREARQAIIQLENALV